MSFALTTPQILDRSKTVTRRTGWVALEPGALLQAVEKGQGLKKGESVRKLTVIRVLGVRRERLDRIDDEVYGREECIAEGFPELTSAQFIRMFCAGHACTPHDFITRIEFTYVEDPS